MDHDDGNDVKSWSEMSFWQSVCLRHFYFPIEFAGADDCDVTVKAKGVIWMFDECLGVWNVGEQTRGTSCGSIIFKFREHLRLATGRV